MLDTTEPIIYPTIEDPQFNEKLQSLPLFNQYKYQKDEYFIEKMIELSEKKCNDTGGYIYKNIQLFVSSFLSINTPYNGLLLYHGVGVGKSCSSILIANNFKEYVKKNNKKIIILTSRAIQDSFKKEIFNTETEMNKIDLNEFTCTSNEYSNEWKDFINNNPDISKMDADKQFRDGIIGEYFQIFGYQEFVLRYKKQIEIRKDIYNKEKINALFSNTVFIIDEVHNLRDNNGDAEGEGESEGEKEKSKKSKKKSEKLDVKGIKKIIQAIMQNLDMPIKLILLSATPMYDLYTEFNFIINLLLLNDKKELLSQAVIDRYIKNQNKESKLEILKKINGYISYIKGNDPTIFPLILYPNNNKTLYFETGTNLNHSEKINVYLCEMKEYQTNLYKKVKKGIINKSLKERYSNITFPINKSTNEPYIFETLFENKNDIYIPTNKEIANDFLENIENYAIKISELLKNISECKNGKIFIYTSKKIGDYAGTYFLQIILEHNGFVRKTIEKEKLIIKNSYNLNLTSSSENFKGYYTVAPANDDFDSYIENFNNKNNNLGDEIKILIGTTNMFEGVSLSNVRQIHLLEPWYNMSRNEQIIGRGSRQCSHIDLPFENRNFTVFNYVAISDINNKNKYEEVKDGYIVKYKKTSFEMDFDIRKLQLATEKIINIEYLDKLLKANAIDCFLNKNVNDITIKNIIEEEQNVIEFKDYKNESKFVSFVSDSDIICENIEQNENDIYKYQYKTFLNKNLIKNTCFFIKTIFKKSIDNQNNHKIYYTYEQLFDQTKLYNSELDDNLFKISLQELILNKEIFYNKFNNPGYIIVNGQYYIFKNINSENINIPYEFNTYPYNIKIDSIKNFSDFSINVIKSSKSQSSNKPKDLEKTEETKTPEETKKSEEKKATEETKKSEESKTPEETKKSEESKTLNQKSDKNKKRNIQNDLNNLLNICYENGLELLSREDLKKTYESLHNSFKTKTQNKFEAIINNNFNFTLASKENLYENIFKQLFRKNLNRSQYKEIDEDLLNRFYESYFTLPFLFNYGEFITTHLKCIFYKKFIKKKDLTEIEQNIFNHYENLIVSEEPLIFKFIDWSGNSSVLGDSNNNYSYKYLGIVYYEYYENEWVYYNKIYQTKTTSFKTLSKINLNFFKIMISSKEQTTLDNISKDFIKNELYGSEKDIQENEWNRIYNTFNYHLYTNTNINNGYFKYSGNPKKPFSELLKSDKILNKLDNIIGLPLLYYTDKELSFYKLSRNIFPLCLLYNLKEEDSERFTYFKNAFHSDFKGLGKEISKEEKNKHIIYCILDQVEELNIKLCLEIILSNDVSKLWKQEDEFKFEIYKLLEKIDLKNPVLEEEEYNLLKEYLSDFKEDFTDIDNLEDINEKLNKNKYKFYTNLPFIYEILNYISEPIFIQLIGYILYDLDKLNFYNKKWLLGIYETSLLNSVILDIKLTNKRDKKTEKIGRLGDTFSITKNSFISAKIPDEKFKKKSIELDIIK